MCIALQAYVDDGCDRLSVSSMERFDVALRTFRAELASEQEVIEASTACAGLVICSLCVSPPIPPRGDYFGLPRLLDNLRT